MAEDYLKFKGVTHFNRDLVSNNLLYGLIDFFDWAMLDIGAYQNITRSPATSGVFGGQKFRLRPVEDKRYTNGQVWEGFRGNWVWESGVEYEVPPIIPSGVWVGSTFYPTSSTTGTYSHYINYPLGRVIFNTAIATNSNVQTEFSTKYITFTSIENKIARELKMMVDTSHVERGDFLSSASGLWRTLGDERFTLPSVAIAINPNSRWEPYQIGGGQYLYQSVTFYVFADNPYDKNQISDIIKSQNDRALWIPNRGLMKESANYPLSLDYRGSPVPSALRYPDMVSASGYRWRYVYLTNMVRHDWEPVGNILYRAEINATVEIVMEEV